MSKRQDFYSKKFEGYIQMNSRIEQKLEINKDDYLDVLKWLKKNNAKSLYPTRLISSIYFDTNNLEMFYETLEGFVPRKKIRIRTYDCTEFTETKGIYNLEIKLTTENERYKNISKNINLKDALRNGIFDDKYGICWPKIKISYKREYFIIKDYRITIDSDIQYEPLVENKISLKDIFKDNSMVLEIKVDANIDKLELIKQLPFPITRFSKYERAINYLLE